MAQKSRNRIAVVWVMRMGAAVVWVMRMGAVNKGMIVSCTHKNKRTNILYRPTHPRGWPRLLMDTTRS